jgi:hypothetical protein
VLVEQPAPQPAILDPGQFNQFNPNIWNHDAQTPSTAGSVQYLEEIANSSGFVIPGLDNAIAPGQTQGPAGGFKMTPEIENLMKLWLDVPPVIVTPLLDPDAPFKPLSPSDEAYLQGIIGGSTSKSPYRDLNKFDLPEIWGGQVSVDGFSVNEASNIFKDKLPKGVGGKFTFPLFPTRKPPP